MIQVRLANASDIGEIAVMEHAEYGREGYPELFFWQALHQWPHGFFVAEDDTDHSTSQSVLGYILYAPGAGKNHIWCMSLLSSPHARGRGVGKRLLHESLRHLAKLNIDAIELTVAPNNTQAWALYSQAGFQTLAEYKDHLGKGEHRLHMLLADLSAYR
ncbi:GNAT family N-acetyltransferase [Aliidiomarina indica]|uniref:GNAT family N-acetyltransferase n=1 Tax=Aliidiomarina indica TaxID=2749147 RepID=UPI0018907C1C|nr:N-acetyltransferase [Aliidiomarina indica]